MRSTTGPAGPVRYRVRQPSGSARAAGHAARHARRQLETSDAGRRLRHTTTPAAA